MKHWAKIGKKTLPVTIDEDGRPHLPLNRLVSDIRDIAADHGLDLNRVARMVGNGSYTEDERRELYQQIGYTLDGYGEIFPRDTMDSCCWRARDAGRLKEHLKRGK